VRLFVCNHSGRLSAPVIINRLRRVSGISTDATLKHSTAPVNSDSCTAKSGSGYCIAVSLTISFRRALCPQVVYDDDFVFRSRIV
jgi:hypothetical protein